MLSIPRVMLLALSLEVLFVAQAVRITQRSAAANATGTSSIAAVLSPPFASSGATIKVVSYNLYWWNAFQQNPWKSDSIVNNIRYNLQADTLGLQECNEPYTIQSRAGYSPASRFADNQGVSVRPGAFSVGQAGSMDLGATGYWGPRHVTWAQLTQISSGRTFWHFNTHWCVRDCGADKRFVGAQNMLNRIRQLAGSSPVVITGDFNAGMGEPGIQHFLQNGFALAVSHWVDAIFYSTAHWSVVSTATGDAAGSDHRPVSATLQLGGSSGPAPSPVPTPSGGCTDGYSECEAWAGQGYCSQSSEHYQFMVENCCSSCSGGGPAPSPVPTPSGGGNVYCDPNSNPPQYCPSGARCPACGGSRCVCP